MLFETLLTKIRQNANLFINAPNEVAVAFDRAPVQQESPVQVLDLRTEEVAEEKKSEEAEGLETPASTAETKDKAEIGVRKVGDAEAFKNLANMSMAEFAKARLVAKVQSSVLGKTVIFASDNAQLKEEDKGDVVYRASELRFFADNAPDAETLKAIDRVKSIFNGRVIDIKKITKEADKNERDKTIDDRGNSQGVQAV